MIVGHFEDLYNFFGRLLKSCTESVFFDRARVARCLNSSMVRVESNRPLLLT